MALTQVALIGRRRAGTFILDRFNSGDQATGTGQFTRRTLVFHLGLKATTKQLFAGVFKRQGQLLVAHVAKFGCLSHGSAVSLLTFYW